jgi:nucleotide-binding universal stress UspA family protein
MRKIILGLHGGASADGAVHLARLLRERTGAAIDALAVFEPLPIADCGYEPVFMPDPANEDALEEQLHVDVEQQLTRCDLEDIKPSILHGPRTASIAEAASARDADLILVGIGPHHLTDRALGGETALYLAQQASTPVLAVPAGMRSLPRRILVAVDFSPASAGAARFAASLLTTGDTLQLVHVGAGARLGGVTSGRSRTREEWRRLDEFAADIQLPTGAHLLTDVFTGRPARALLDTASQTGAGLIALGNHGYNPWQRLFLGSVSSKVLRVAECAVLVYPARCVGSENVTVHAEGMIGATST